MRGNGGGKNSDEWLRFGSGDLGSQAVMHAIQDDDHYLLNKASCVLCDKINQIIQKKTFLAQSEARRLP